MLIQNISNTAQAAQPAKPSNERLTSDGAPIVVSAPPPSDAAPVESKQIAVKLVTEQPSTPKLQNVVDSINNSLRQANKNLEFSVDPDTKKSVIRLVDTETGEMIRQFPSADAIKISIAIDRIQQGLLLKQKA
jgi:flagellar protein FlaG